MKIKTAITYVVHATSPSVYGLNQDYYFRTEAEAKRRAADLREWYKNIPAQTFSISSHQIIIN